MKELLILGAGTGGAVAANMLGHKLDLKEWRTTIFDRVHRRVIPRADLIKLYTMR